MCAEILHSLSWELGLRVTQELARLPISRVQRWAKKRILVQIERSLNIGKTEFILLEKARQHSQTRIVIHIWSSYPLTLNTQRTIGKLELEEFEEKLEWDITGKSIYKHTVNDLKPNDNAWAFIVKIPTETLKKHAFSYWHLNFVAQFQKEFCKTFKDVKLKFRESDIHRLEEDS